MHLSDELRRPVTHFDLTTAILQKLIGEGDGTTDEQGEEFDSSFLLKE